MIQIKNAKELDGMRRANALSAAALKYGGQHIEAGMTTWELDKLIYDFIVKHGGTPNFKGLYGFPGTACISLNDTIIHGIPSHEAQRLLDVTKAALYKGIEQAKAGNRIGDIGYAVQSYCEDAGFSVVREFVGHGTGRELHEDPEVPNYGHQGRKTKDGGLAAHFEHSNAILKDHTEIMTRFWDDPDFDPETFCLK